MTLLCGGQVFVLVPAQGVYTGPYKLSTDWHSAWYGPCSAMDVGGSGPEIRCLMRNMKPVLSAYADPAKNNFGGVGRRCNLRKEKADAHPVA